MGGWIVWVKWFMYGKMDEIYYDNYGLFIDLFNLIVVIWYYSFVIELLIFYLDFVMFVWFKVFDGFVEIMVICYWKLFIFGL